MCYCIIQTEIYTVMQTKINACAFALIVANERVTYEMHWNVIVLSSLLSSCVLLSSRSPPATVTMGRAPAWGFTCTFTGKLQLAQKPWTLLILEKTPASSAALLPKPLSHSCANFLKPAYCLKRDCFQKITLPSSFWRQLKFPGKKRKRDRTKRTKILDSTDENSLFYSVQDRPVLFWRNNSVVIIIPSSSFSPLLFFIPFLQVPGAPTDGETKERVRIRTSIRAPERRGK